jgi:hypothetical protein
MVLDKIKALLEEMVANEKGEHDAKGLAEAKEALSLLEEVIAEEAPENAEEAAESPEEQAAEGPEGEAAEEKPKVTLHVRVPLKLHEMPMKDLEKHVKGE